MTTEEKQLLLKDLCGRLPYGVIQVFEDNEYPPCAIIGYDGEDFIDEEGWTHRLGEFKPYLRPMSSMTEEERDELYTAMDWYGEIDENGNVYTKGQEKVYRETFYEYTDWLISHHFDFHGLIEKGLALEAPEGMYKED